jgi:protein O-GlcNAc transferase
MTTTPADLLSLAVQHHQAGRLSEAIEAYRAVLSHDPNNPVTLSNLGAAYQQQGDLDQAADCYRRAIAASPQLVEAHGNLGTVLKNQGRPIEALACYRRAIELRPDYAVAHGDLGVVLQELGRLDEAIAAYRRAIELAPGSERAHFNLATALCDCGQVNEALDSYRRATQLRPTFVEAYCNLGNALKDLGRLDEALACYHQALKLAPNYVQAYNNLAGVLQQQGKLSDAVAWYEGALALNPILPEIHSNLGSALREQGRLDEALASQHRALALAPDCAQAYNHLAYALKDQGNLDGAIDAYHRALALRPNAISTHSDLLYTLQFSERYDAAAIHHQHVRFDERHIRPQAQFIQPHQNDRSPDRRLRVGYVSSEFYDHCLIHFTAPLLVHHDPTQVEVFCYADVVRPDEKTQRLRSLAHHWRDILGLSPAQTAELIRDDQIDILVDSTMHMHRGHQLLFARKPAPVQVCWLAYPGTTGISTIDYRLTDPYLDPPGLFDRFYTEQSIRLSDTFWCYDPLNTEPHVNPLPALAAGLVTFGSLNNFCKNNDTTFRLWSRVLNNVPGSRLILLADEGSHRGRTRDFFAEQGIASDRLTFVGRQPRLDYLQTYHQIDIGLDTHPYNGHATSLDSYWMGVPVVTLVGRTVVGRAGLSQLTNLGLTDLIAHAPDEFVAIATGLAGDLSRLADLRQSLRLRMQASPLMNAPRFVHNLESTYRDLWRRWCA